MTNLVTFLRPSKEDSLGIVYTAILGRPSVGLGDIVSITLGKRVLPYKYVSFKSTKLMKDIDQEDLSCLLSAYHDKALFWSKLEQGFGGGIPGEFEVTVLGVSNNHVALVDEDDAAINDDLAELFNEEIEDDLEEFEELFEEEPQVDPVKPKAKKPKDW